MACACWHHDCSHGIPTEYTHARNHALKLQRVDTKSCFTCEPKKSLSMTGRVPDMCFKPHQSDKKSCKRTKTKLHLQRHAQCFLKSIISHSNALLRHIQRYNPPPNIYIYIYIYMCTNHDQNALGGSEKKASSGDHRYQSQEKGPLTMCTCVP